MLKIKITFLGVLFIFFTCVKKNKLENTISSLKEAISQNQVLVTAHRGDWRNFPENSLEGMRSCIKMGVDIMEIDLKMTKDSVLVLMHDETLDRTTTGTGLVKDYTLSAIKKMTLKNGYGFPTPYKVPTLKEALLTAKGKINLDLDKSYSYVLQVYKLVEEANMFNQVIFRINDTWKDFNLKYNTIIPRMNYMPLLWWNTKKPSQFISDYLKTKYPPIAIEILYKNESSSQFLALQKIKDTIKIPFMVNTIYPHLCANRDDPKALLDKDANWGWVIKKGGSIIGTDRPQLLLEYLRSKGLHK